MRKQTTFLAVLSTAVFTASMAFPAYAKAAGWTEENGNWYYYDSRDPYRYMEEIRK